MRAAPTGHSQSQGNVGNVHRTLCGQLRTLLSQVQESTGLKLTSESPTFTWCVKHAQWLINRYLIGSDGKTAYSRRWSREYGGSLRVFGEWIDARLPISKGMKIPKGGSQWFSGVYLGKDTEADEVIHGNANGVFKVRTVSVQWRCGCYLFASDSRALRDVTATATQTCTSFMQLLLKSQHEKARTQAIHVKLR